MGTKDAAVRRQELRRSNAAVPHRNRFREHKSGKGRHGQAVAEGLMDDDDELRDRELP